MLLAKLNGQGLTNEIPRHAMPHVPPPPLGDLRTATVAVVTEAGIVPLGNPDRIELMRATKWGRYSFAGCDALRSGEYESVHGGYDATWVNENPNRAIPVDALRTLERAGEIGHLLENYYVTVGNGGQVADMANFAAAIAAELKDRDVRYRHTWRRYAGTRAGEDRLPNYFDLKPLFSSRAGGLKPSPP
jgi:glycine reductase complex component B subunit gamma